MKLINKKHRQRHTLIMQYFRRHNKTSMLFLTMVCNIIATANVLADEWKLFKHDASDNIKVYFREPPGHSGLIEFKGVTTASTTLSSLVAVIRDVKRMNEWVYLAQEATELERISKTESYTHIIHKSPLWGFDQRDSIVHSVLVQNPNSLEIIFRGTATPKKIPENRQYERVLSGQSQWKLTPLQDSSISITFQGFANPGGMLEKFAFSFMVKNFLWKLPMETLRNLKSQVEKPKYRHVSFDFIKNVKEENGLH